MCDLIKSLDFWHHFCAVERVRLTLLFYSVFENHVLALVHLQLFFRCLYRAPSQRSKIYVGHHIRGNCRLSVIPRLVLRKSLIMLCIYLKSVLEVDNTNYINVTCPFQYCAALLFNTLSVGQTD